MLSVQTIWEVVKPNDRLLYILPDNHLYLMTKSKYLKEFRKTLSCIFKEPISYLVVVSPFQFESIYEYELFYGLEIQEIESVSVFEEPEFQTYIKPKKIYYLNVSFENLLPMLNSTWVDRIIVDDFKFTQDQFDELKKSGIPYSVGKCYSEETINAKLYMGKIIQRLIHSSLEDGMDNDVILIFGKKIKGSIEDYKSILFSYLKENRLTAIYSCHSTYLNTIRSWIRDLKMRVPTQLFPESITQDQYTILLNKLQKINVHYTSFVFIGEFQFASDGIYNQWKKDKLFLKNNSIYDVDAMDTLIGNDFMEDCGYRLTLNPLDLLSMYHELLEE